MSTFAKTLADKIEGYIALRRSLGYAFQNQAAILRALTRYVEAGQLDGLLTRDTALSFVFSWEGTANRRAISHGIVRRFCEYLAIYDPRTEALDPRTLPRSRAIPPPRILSDAELGSLMSACRRVSPGYPERGTVLTIVIGLLASTGLRSGEALRLDRNDVDLTDGVSKDQVPQGPLGSGPCDDARGLTYLCSASRCGISGPRRIPHFFSARAAADYRRQGFNARLPLRASSPVSTRARP
jgi:integrase